MESGKIVGKTCPFRGIQHERKKTGQTGGGDYEKLSPANYITWINLVSNNAFHYNSCLHRFRTVTFKAAQFTAPGLSAMAVHGPRNIQSWCANGSIFHLKFFLTVCKPSSFLPQFEFEIETFCFEIGWDPVFVW